MSAEAGLGRGPPVGLAAKTGEGGARPVEPTAAAEAGVARPRMHATKRWRGTSLPDRPPLDPTDGRSPDGGVPSRSRSGDAPRDGVRKPRGCGGGGGGGGGEDGGGLFGVGGGPWRTASGSGGSCSPSHVDDCVAGARFGGGGEPHSVWERFRPMMATPGASSVMAGSGLEGAPTVEGVSDVARKGARMRQWNRGRVSSAGGGALVVAAGVHAPYEVSVAPELLVEVRARRRARTARRS